ncbi:MAG: DUF2007 domain-containing protein [Saprospiraceae bacterium]|nr:DUF2007 domain-containing protein [Saprospiraceae bacterium]
MKTTLIFFSISDLKITTARHILAEAGIETFVINKKDTIYAGILGGKVEVYVRQEDEEKANKLLVENEMFD